MKPSPIASPALREQARGFLLSASYQRKHGTPSRARACWLACKLCLRRSRDPFFV